MRQREAERVVRTLPHVRVQRLRAHAILRCGDFVGARAEPDLEEVSVLVGLGLRLTIGVGCLEENGGVSYRLPLSIDDFAAHNALGQRRHRGHRQKDRKGHGAAEQMGPHRTSYK